MISRWSSPMPPISVWPVSSSEVTRNVGSSSASRWRPLPSLSWSAFDFGSTATWITGSGNVIDSSTMGAFSAESVSPVVVFFKPTPAAISPAMVEQRLHALVLERGAEQHRRDLVGDRPGAHCAANLVGGHRRLVLDVRLEHLVVEVRDRVDQLVVVLVRLLGELGRDVGGLELLP